MSRTKSHFQKKEPLLEKFLQVLRFRKVIPYIRKGNKILDLGCGYNGALLDKLSSKISEGVGIDISVTNQKKANNIKLISRKIGGNIYLPRNHFDLVACLALLEHLERAKVKIKED